MRGASWSQLERWRRLAHLFFALCTDLLPGLERFVRRKTRDPRGACEHVPRADNAVPPMLHLVFNFVALRLYLLAQFFESCAVLCDAEGLHVRQRHPLTLAAEHEGAELFSLRQKGLCSR